MNKTQQLREEDFSIFKLHKNEIVYRMKNYYDYIVHGHDSHVKTCRKFCGWDA